MPLNNVPRSAVMAEQSSAGRAGETETTASPADGYETTIRTTALCASCGRNLKGEPFVSTCPRCGAAYNARRAVSPGVYYPGAADFPWTRLLSLIGAGALAAVCIVLWIWLGRKAVLPIANVIPLAAVVFGGYAVFLLPLLIRDLYHYGRQCRWERVHARSILEDRREREARRAAVLVETPPAGRKPLVPPGDKFLEGLAEEGHLAPIDWPALCATCGYRLQGLARRGICPECGSEYNARTHQMTGILSPYGGSRSWGNIWAAFICAGLAALFLQSMIARFFVGKLVFAILFAAGAFGFAVVAARKGRQYRFARQALKQIRAEEGEQEDIW